MTTIDYEDAPALLPELPARRVAVAGPLRTLVNWFTRRRAERLTLDELAHMDAYLLRDIGIEPSDVQDALNGKRNSVLFNPFRRRGQE